MKKITKIRNYFANNKYISLTPKLDFIKKCDGKMSIIKKNFNYLLKKSKEQMLLDKKMKEIQKQQFIDLEKINLDKRLKLEKKKNLLLKKHQLILSSYNNKMLLDMMLDNGKFIKFLMDKRVKNIKTEGNYNKPNHLLLSSKKINNTITNIETNIDNNKNLDNIKYLKNSEINITYNNNNINSNIINGKSGFKINEKKSSISFPISSAIFKTSIQISNPKYSETPKKSLLSLRKKKSLDDKFIFNIHKERLMTDYIINNKINLKQYSSSLINNKNPRSNFIFSKKNISEYKIISNKKRLLSSFNYKKYP